MKQTDQQPISTNPLADGAGHTLLKERIQHSNRIKGLLFGQGGFFRRPPFVLTRSRNHWLRTELGWWRSHSQANWKQHGPQARIAGLRDSLVSVD